LLVEAAAECAHNCYTAAANDTLHHHTPHHRSPPNAPLPGPPPPPHVSSPVWLHHVEAAVQGACSCTPVVPRCLQAQQVIHQGQQLRGGQVCGQGALGQGGLVTLGPCTCVCVTHRGCVCGEGGGVGWGGVGWGGDGGQGVTEGLGFPCPCVKRPGGGRWV
jgi:hypothetical protein